MFNVAARAEFSMVVVPLATARNLMLLKEWVGNLVNGVVMTELEIWHSAGDLVSRYGAEGAVFEAVSRADRNRTVGNMAAAHDWSLVLHAVQELVRSPVAREALH